MLMIHFCFLATIYILPHFSLLRAFGCRAGIFGAAFTGADVLKSVYCVGLHFVASEAADNS